MTTQSVLRIALAALLLVLAAASGAHAQVFRAYVSATGNDANPCTLQRPCRLLPAALNAVADGGEIWLLDSANYNTATVEIAKSVSVLAVPGVVGSIVALNGGPAVSILANGLEIALRNVVIGPVVSGMPGTAGVDMTGNSTLSIEGSLIANLPSYGVRVEGSGVVKITDTTVRNNGSSAVGAFSGASVDVAGSQLVNNQGHGVYAYAGSGTTTILTVTDTLISGSKLAGAAAFSAAADATARIAITRSTITRSGNYALYVNGSGGTSEIFVGSTLVAYNNMGWFVTRPAIYSSGNNQFFGNATPSFGALTALPLE